MKRISLTLVAAVGLACWTPTARAWGFDGIVSFGDSLSDVGNVYTATGGAQPAPPQDYYMGHYSNGIIWLEYLARDLGLPAPKPSLLGGTDYAFGGAQTGTGTSVLGTPNVGTQIATYLATNTPGPNQLFTLWAGANDFLNAGQTDPTVPVNNIAAEVTTLAQAGVRTLIVPNLPLLGNLPLSSSVTPDQRAGLNALSAAFDGLLAAKLDGLQASLGITIEQLDIESLVARAQADPAAFGLTNATDSALFSNNGDATGYLFWDQVHPTTYGHQIVAATAFGPLNPVPEPSSLVLASLGGLALVGYARRRRASA